MDGPKSNEAAVRAAAQVLKLPIAAEHLPGVLRFYALAAMLAEPVMAMPLGPADEAGNVFKPVEPRSAES
jgi:Protein of unknown function (DUF4089)